MPVSIEFPKSLLPFVPFLCLFGKTCKGVVVYDYPQHGTHFSMHEEQIKSFGLRPPFFLAAMTDESVHDVRTRKQMTHNRTSVFISLKQNVPSAKVQEEVRRGKQ